MKGKKCRSCDRVNPPDRNRCLGCASDIEFEPTKEFDELENDGVLENNKPDFTASDYHPDRKNKNSNWGGLLKSSLLIGLTLSIAWMAIVVAVGAYKPSTASGISGLLGNAFGIFILFSGVSFVYKALNNVIKSKISKDK